MEHLCFMRYFSKYSANNLSKQVSQIDYMLESFCVGEMFGHHTYIHTVPPETMGPFAEILPRSNRGFDLQFHLGKTV